MLYASINYESDLDNKIINMENFDKEYHTGASLVDQYPITLVHIVGFKIIKN